MKFAKLFSCYQIPEWYEHYLDYRGFKKLIKEINIIQDTLFYEKYYNNQNNEGNTGGEYNSEEDKLLVDGRKSEPPRKRRDGTILGDNIDVNKEEDSFFNNEEIKERVHFFILEFNKEIEDIENFYLQHYNLYCSRLNLLILSTQFNDILPLLSTHSYLNEKILELKQFCDSFNSTITDKSDNPVYYNPSNKDMLKSSSLATNSNSSNSASVNNLKLPNLIDYDLANNNSATISGINGYPYSTSSNNSQVSTTILNNNLQIIDEIEEILNFLLDLRLNYRNLKLFKEMNKRALFKLIKKVHKKIGYNMDSNDEVKFVNIDNFLYDSNISKLLDYINSISVELTTILNSITDNSSSSPNNNNFNANLITLSSPFDRFNFTNTDNYINNKSLKDISNETRIIYDSIENDNIIQTINNLTEIYKATDNIPMRTQINLLNLAVFSESSNCIAFMITSFNSIWHQNKLNKRNFFHHHIISLSKLIENFSDIQDADMNRNGTEAISATNSSDNIVSKIEILTAGFKYLLDHLPTQHILSLLEKDIYERTPLHYASKFGLNTIVNYIISTLKECKHWDSNMSIANVNYWGDYENMTPVHLAIVNSHPSTLEELLKLSYISAEDSSILLYTTRLGKYELLEILLKCNNLDVNITDKETNETSLYLACKLNHQNMAQTLLEYKANTELFEKTFNWTPIFIASVEGYSDIVQLLLKHNANYNIFDSNGWTPMEHAALRGFLEIANLLKIKNNPNITSPNIKERDQLPINIIQPYPSSVSISSLALDPIGDSNTMGEQYLEKRPSTLFKAKDSSTSNIQESITSFGHKILNTSESELIITLGSHYMFKTDPALQFFSDNRSSTLFDDLDMEISLVITYENALSDKKIVIDLPLDDSRDIIKFRIPHNNKNDCKVYFDLVPVYNKRTIDSLKYQENINNASIPCIGRGVALLSNIKQPVGPNMRSLDDNITLPIIRLTDSNIIGTVNFNFMIIKPFHNSNINLELESKYWRSLVSTRVIGHRGLGKNINTKKSLQLGENTVESFIAAASLGASYVEFDVQLTKDNVPVVYHDFLIGETGVDVPMHELTAEQFLQLNNNKLEPFMKPGIRNRRLSLDGTESLSKVQTWNGNDDKSKDIDETKSKYNEYFGKNLIEERMKLTKSFQKYNYKGNARGHTIASSFVTLKELFKKIPENVGFNIEMKYPMLDEAIEEGASILAHEMNHWVDTVLNVIFDNINGRDVIFSSFHPDICIMLSLKQSAIPILFLTEGGATRMEDIRASSLQNAIKFARTWNLLGIVSAAEPILKAPRLVQVIKSSGLVCVTYGVENNDTDNVEKEMNAGVDAVIVDNVLAIRKGLTKTIAN
ncbi:hypothetical protein TBLA_0B04300 [Henningerozyma blattae CBS 6284]|uniref:GP-PDE domain-containing protein n=1 Tax=Henningerozyma blattae (strain ATCC 34711 / CBS 6284 / DSM 70876 / NBRC 10599 / NRRL Y-10934 / UCD 77-7) TaxID=1071380 RepID=I2GYR5_HENB6|nr:hypothetical protein TBLA_0B04300 [Tetrapisispora blattae CBS 6284]CCH59267.1 hypothetical protein TBLA_0B04300 [Tetrapisispora blattae CBS 6284]